MIDPTIPTPAPSGTAALERDRKTLTAFEAGDPLPEGPPLAPGEYALHELANVAPAGDHEAAARIEHAQAVAHELGVPRSALRGVVEALYANGPPTGSSQEIGRRLLELADAHGIPREVLATFAKRFAGARDLLAARAELRRRGPELIEKIARGDWRAGQEYQRLKAAAMGGGK